MADALNDIAVSTQTREIIFVATQDATARNCGQAWLMEGITETAKAPTEREQRIGNFAQISGEVRKHLTLPPRIGS